MEVSLTRIVKSELRSAWHMQQKCFVDVYLKYFDRINPIFNSYQKFVRYFQCVDMYWIIADKKRVGQIWIGIKGDTVRLARIFVLRKHRNKGYAQYSIAMAESLYPQCKSLQLDTILQEKRNCHLYEKAGYKSCGAQSEINKRMTIINYEKHWGDSCGKQNSRIL